MYCFCNQFGRTEMILNCLNPKFSKKFVLDYYFEMVQRLKFCMYDIDNNSYTLEDDDFLGELECTLGQVSFLRGAWTVQLPWSLLNFLSLSFFCSSCIYHQCDQIVSSRQMTRSLLLKDRRPAGHGTITVSTPWWLIHSNCTSAKIRHPVANSFSHFPYSHTP